MTTNPERNWERFGQTEPYFAVISDDRFKRENLDPSAIDAFFDSGESHLRWVLGVIEQKLTRNFRPKECLDFGCGVGRVVIPMALRFSHVTGVDISRSMQQEAWRNCSERGIRNVSFVSSIDDLAADATFGFVHCMIVLQHIPPRQGRPIIEKLVDLVAPRGVGVLHVTYGSRRPRVRQLIHWTQKSVPFVHNMINLQNHRPFDYPLMAMYRYDLDWLFRVLQDRACSAAYVSTTDHVGHLGAVVFFQKDPATIPA